MRTEGHTLLRDLAQLAQGKDLEAAAVRENGAIPMHELMQAAGLLDELHAGAQEEVIGIGQDDARPQILQLIRRDALDGRLRAHGHENRRKEAPVRGMDNPRAGSRRLILPHQLIRYRCQKKTSKPA